MDDVLPATIERGATTVRNFVLPAEKVVPADNDGNRFYVDAGEELYPEWQAQFEDSPGKKDERGKQAMNRDLLKILANSNKDIDNQKLMDYLSGKLSEQENYEVERWMTENEFGSEAVEGLQQFAPAKNIDGYVDDLNKELSRYINTKKKRRKRRSISDANWLYLAIIIVLLLIIIGYLVIKNVSR